MRLRLRLRVRFKLTFRIMFNDGIGVTFRTRFRVRLRPRQHTRFRVRFRVRIRLRMRVRFLIRSRFGYNPVFCESNFLEQASTLLLARKKRAENVAHQAIEMDVPKKLPLNVPLTTAPTMIKQMQKENYVLENLKNSTTLSRYVLI